MCLPRLSKFFQSDGTYHKYNNLGTAYLNQHNFPAAIAAFTKAIKYGRTNKQKASSYLSRGDCYFDQKKFAAALADFDKSVTLCNGVENARAYLARGTAHRELYHDTQCLEDFTQGLALLQDHKTKAIAHMLLGNFYFMKKNHVAIEHYKQAVQLDSSLGAELTLKKLKVIYENDFNLYNVVKKHFFFTDRLLACGRSENVKETLMDPVFYEVMNKPIAFTHTGQTYNRKTIADLFARHGNPDFVHCPLTGKLISRTEFETACVNVNLNNEIEDFVSEQERLGRPTQHSQAFFVPHNEQVRRLRQSFLDSVTSSTLRSANQPLPMRPLSSRAAPGAGPSDLKGTGFRARSRAE